MNNKKRKPKVRNNTDLVNPEAGLTVDLLKKYKKSKSKARNNRSQSSKNKSDLDNAVFIHYSEISGNGLYNLEHGQTVSIKELEILDVVDSKPLSITNQRSIREWWHNILRSHEQYSCYAIFLILPSDKETIRYLREFGQELDLISGKECLVLALGKTNFRGPKFNKHRWNTAVNEQAAEGHSIKMARILGIEYQRFPCLVLFKDVRTPHHVILTLKGLQAENIAESLRQVFSVITKAVSDKKDPIIAVENLRRTRIMRRAGTSFISEIRNLTHKTLETVIEALINPNTK